MKKRVLPIKGAVTACIMLCMFFFAISPKSFDVSVSAQSAVLINAENGDIYFEKNADSPLPMASTTKIMTALVALESSDISDTVIIDRRAVGVEGSSVYLTEGELLTMENLLYALLLASANDAAAAIAIEVGGSIEEFAVMMNRKAKELGLENSHFDNPHGLDSETHYTSAKDLAVITAEALKNETFAKIVSTYKTTIPANGGSRYLINHNKLLSSYDGAVGVKTGFTKRSGRCLVSAAERDGLKLIAVTINAPDDWNDHRAMLDRGFSSYHKLTLLREGEYTLSLPVTGGKEQTVLCRSTAEISTVFPRGVTTDMCSLSIEASRFLYAPVKNGMTVGKVAYTYEGKLIGESELITEYTVPALKQKKSFFEKVSDFLKNIFT